MTIRILALVVLVRTLVNLPRACSPGAKQCIFPTRIIKNIQVLHFLRIVLLSLPKRPIVCLSGVLGNPIMFLLLSAIFPILTNVPPLLHLIHRLNSEPPQAILGSMTPMLPNYSLVLTYLRIIPPAIRELTPTSWLVPWISTRL